MWHYKLRDYLGWIILFALLAALVFYGYRLATEQTLLRLGTGSEGSVSHELGQVLKGAIEQHTGYQVLLVPESGTMAAREALVKRRTDLSVLIPAAMPGRQAVSSLGPLGHLGIYLMVDPDRVTRGLAGLAGNRLAAGPTESDGYRLARRLIASLGLAGEVKLAGAEAREQGTFSGELVLARAGDPMLAQRLAERGWRLLDLSHAGALVAQEPLVSWSPVAPGTFSQGGALMPETRQMGLVTPLALMVRDDMQASLVYRLMDALGHARTQAELASFGFEPRLWKQGLTALPRHPAAEAYLKPSDLFASLAPVGRILMAYRWLVVLTILALGLGLWRWSQSRRMRASCVQAEQRQLLANLMRDLLKIEQAQKDEQDWKRLEQLQRDLAALKGRGISLLLETELGESHLAILFINQCHQLDNELNWRLSLSQQRRDNPINMRRLS